MSYNYIPVSLASTLHFTYPAIVTVLSILIFKEKLEPMKIISLALSIIGVYILADSGEASINLKGVIFALASGVFYSIYTIELARAEIKVMEGLLLTFYVSLLSAASIFIFGAVTGSLMFTMQPSAIFGILGLALVCTVFAILAYYKAVQIVGPSDTAILSTFEPVTGVVLGMIVFGERLSLSASIGSSLIIVSVLFFSYNRNTKAREEEFSKVSEN
jgi:drug/metabolite transporter (DMT)-like permease